MPTNDWTLVAKELFGNHAPGHKNSIIPSLVPRSFYAGEATHQLALLACKHAIRQPSLQLHHACSHHVRALCALQAWWCPPALYTLASRWMQHSICRAPQPWAARVVSCIATEVRHRVRCSLSLLLIPCMPANGASNCLQQRRWPSACAQQAQSSLALLRPSTRRISTASCSCAREFRPNGLLFVIVPGTLGGINCGQGALTTIGQAAAELAAEGRIDAAQLERYMLPVFFPTLKAR